MHFLYLHYPDYPGFRGNAAQTLLGHKPDFGRAKIEISKQNRNWNPTKVEPMTEEHIRDFEDLLKSYKTAWANFEKMPRSSRKAYAASYIYTKTAEGKQKRLNTIIERLNLNVNPMESMKKDRNFSACQLHYTQFPGFQSSAVVKSAESPVQQLFRCGLSSMMMRLF